MSIRLAILFLIIAIQSFGVTLGSEDRPNFLFILVDDQNPATLGCYGNTVCQTPNIDQIAKNGIKLVDAHHMGSWRAAVCQPSRTMIMTGKNLWRHPDRRPKGMSEREFKDQRKKINRIAARTSLPAILNDAGYDTFRTCKAGNTFKAANALFNEAYD